MISEAKLDFWINNNLNVLFTGEHGVGKTTVVLEAFKRNNLKWLYFSAATMDPWVDFIGVPKEKVDEKGNSYLDLVRPKVFQDDEVEAIFMDEFNRASAKVRNAVMELIQFKSINGKRFNNLRLIWAAINPDNVEDEDQKYDVEKLDPAQMDRFQVHVEVPYKPDRSYFGKKYNEIGIAAIEWWQRLDKKVQKEVSPRRLDYALDLFNRKGDIRDVLPDCANVSAFLQTISSIPFKKQMNAIVLSKNIENAKKFIADENSYNSLIPHLAEKKYREFFLPLFPPEKLVQVVSKHAPLLDFIIKNPKDYMETLKEIVSAGLNQKICKRIIKSIPQLRPQPVAKNPSAKVPLTISSHIPAAAADVLNSKSVAHQGTVDGSNARIRALNSLLTQQILAAIPSWDQATIQQVLHILNAICIRGQSNTLAIRPGFAPFFNKLIHHFYITTQQINPQVDHNAFYKSLATCYSNLIYRIVLKVPNTCIYDDKYDPSIN